MAKWLRRRTRRSLATSPLGPNIASLAAHAVAVGVFAIAGSFVLGLFGANWTALLALLSVSTLAVGLALQDLLKNFVAGIYLLLERPFSIGDRIQVNDFEGTVESIDIRTVALRNARDERILVPNAAVLSEILVNRSSYRTGSTALRLERIALPWSEIERGIQCALEGIQGLRQPAPSPRLERTGSEGATVGLTVWHSGDELTRAAVVAALHSRFPDVSISVDV
ncbi:MAG: mechanosensitive ion channel family protein [Chloroflexota bacterium]|nr:mechanosensitive ion channel family protein [Chloroflexota bacterium]